MNVMLHPVPVPDLAARFIAKPLQLLIGGEWVDAKSGKTFDVFDPVHRPARSPRPRKATRRISMRRLPPRAVRLKAARGHACRRWSAAS